MKKSDLKFLVVGTGAIGGITAAFTLNTVIVNMMHQIEQKRRDIAVSNFDDPFFDSFI